MSYCNIDDWSKPHLLKLIDFIYHEVISSGGDGDSLWFSRFYNIKDILPLIEEYNSNLKFKWQINYDESRKMISWGDNQEWAIITNNEEIYKTAPDWEQCKIRY